MLTRRYHVLMQTLIGNRIGTMEIQVEKNRIRGYLNLLNHTEPFEGSIDGDGNCSISGKLITLMNTIPYTATGQIATDSLNLILKGGQNTFYVKGTAFKEK